MDITTILAIFGIGFLGSFVNAVSTTGSAAIILPALMLLGVPPHVAIASFRFGCVGANVSQIYKYYKARKIAYKFLPVLITLSVTGAIIGTYFLIKIPSETLSKLVALLILATIPFIFLKKMGLTKKIKSKRSIRTGYVMFFLLYIYNGLIGIMAGFFAAIMLVYYFGLTFVESIATKQTAFMFALFVGITILYLAGHFNLLYGILLFLGMMAGGWAGAHTVLKKGNNFVRYAVIIVVAFFALKLLFF